MIPLRLSNRALLELGFIIYVSLPPPARNGASTAKWVFHNNLFSISLHCQRTPRLEVRRVLPIHLTFTRELCEMKLYWFLVYPNQTALIYDHWLIWNSQVCEQHISFVLAISSQWSHCLSLSLSVHLDECCPSAWISVVCPFGSVMSVHLDQWCLSTLVSAVCPTGSVMSVHLDQCDCRFGSVLPTWISVVCPPGSVLSVHLDTHARARTHTHTHARAHARTHTHTQV